MQNGIEGREERTNQLDWVFDFYDTNLVTLQALVQNEMLLRFILCTSWLYHTLSYLKVQWLIVHGSVSAFLYMESKYTVFVNAQIVSDLTWKSTRVKVLLLPKSVSG